MLVMAFFSWWYGPGWQKASRRLGEQLHDTYYEFSVPMLATTLFQPWRRIITPPGTSLGDHFRAFIDNLISRAVGATMRIFTLLAALALLTIYSVGGAVLLVLWPFLPILGPVLIIWGLL